MIYFLFWLVSLVAFIVALLPNKRLFSQAHHFWYGSTIFWMGVACPIQWLKMVLVIIGAFFMFDDMLEHFFGISFILDIYGRLGGTL